MDFFENYEWEAIQIPINITELERLLRTANYDAAKTEYLITGFQQGFSIGYQGKQNRRDLSENLPLHLGTKTDRWNKVMKEVGHKRYAGPYKFEDLPVKNNFIQSPIGLVPKADNQTRLIFHLQYDFKNGNSSLNANTPEEICKVKYRDLDHAVDACIKLLKVHGWNNTLFYSKSDIKSVFRLVPVLVIHRKWLVMKAENPATGDIMFFIDLCLPFCASISCAVFQAFSDALKFLVEYLLQVNDIITNYLDDFLFVAVMREECDRMMVTFMRLCEKINCPLSYEKTEWTSVVIVFFGNTT